MAQLIDLTGKRFGKLVAIRRFDTERKNVYWLCRCDCGNEKAVAGQDLRRGLTRTCGTCGKFKPFVLSFFEYRNMEFSAARRGIIWDLNRKQASRIVSNPCHYCGTESDPRGLGRVDNREGYVLSNVVSCCDRCSSARDAIGPEPFEEWIAQIRTSLR